MQTQKFRLLSRGRLTSDSNLIPISTHSFSNMTSSPLLLGDLRVAVAEFNLPYSVNIIEAWDATSGSLAILNEVAIIELRLSSAII